MDEETGVTSLINHGNAVGSRRDNGHGEDRQFARTDELCDLGGEHLVDTVVSALAIGCSVLLAGSPLSTLRGAVVATDETLVLGTSTGNGFAVA